MMSKFYVTKEGYDKLLEEYNYLVNVDSKIAIQDLADARDKGDISENAEYESAIEYINKLNFKINNIKNKINNSEIIKLDKSSDIIQILSTVKIKNDKGIFEWKLVPENEVNVSKGMISFNSPIGKSLLGRKKGDNIIVEIPKGKINIQILDVLNK